MKALLAKLAIERVTRKVVKKTEDAVPEKVAKRASDVAAAALGAGVVAKASGVGVAATELEIIAAGVAALITVIGRAIAARKARKRGDDESHTD